MVSTIPLFQLPEGAIKITLKHFDITELIFLSILSKRAKCLVKSDTRNAYNITVDSSTGCTVYLHTSTNITLGESQQRESDIQSLTPCTVRVRRQRPLAGINFVLPGFSVRDCLAHFMCIFNYCIINLSFGARHTWMYSLDSIRKVVKGFSIGNLEVFEHACEILKYFPIMSSLYLSSTELQLSEADSNFFKKALLGNIARLRICSIIPINLNTLLMINSPDIYISRNSITEKELNMFLKLWSKGAGPNLRKIGINFLRVRNGLHLNHSVILKGIKCDGLNEGNVFQSRNTIWKRDGTRGILLITPISFYFEVQL